MDAKTDKELRVIALDEEELIVVVLYDTNTNTDCHLVEIENILEDIEPTYVPDTETNRKVYRRGRRLDSIMVSKDLLACNIQIIHKPDWYYQELCNLGDKRFDLSRVRMLINKERVEVGPGQFKLDLNLISQEL